MSLGPPLLYILWAGDAARDVAQRLASGFDQEQKAASSGSACSVEPLSALRKLVSTPGSEKIWVVVVVQTVEQGAIAEDGASALRFLQRRDHANNFLKGRVNFAVMGLGDSNLLLDRQSTGAKDCNQAAKAIDTRLALLGASQLIPRGEADERTGLEAAVEPWCCQLWEALFPGRAAKAAAAAAAETATAAAATAAKATAVPTAEPAVVQTAVPVPDHPSQPTETGNRRDHPSSSGSSAPVRQTSSHKEPSRGDNRDSNGGNSSGTSQATQASEPGGLNIVHVAAAVGIAAVLLVALTRRR